MSKSTAERTTIFNTAAPQTTLLTVNIFGITKLTNQNYLMWCRQVRALLEGHELHHFIEDSSVIPSPTITIDGASSPNPAFTPWRRQDRLLYSSLIGSISLPVQSVVSTATTTHEVWETLAQTFGNPTRGHIRQLKLQLRTCVKGSKSISEYLRLIKAKSDDLAFLGKPLDAEDLTEHILAGLGDEYKPVIDAVNGRDKPISFVELHERLINHEATLLCTELASAIPVVANAVESRNRQHPRGSNGSRQQPPSGPTQHCGYHGSNGGHGYQSRPNKHYQGKCQACGEFGHSVKFCNQFRIVRSTSDQSPWMAPASQTWSQPAQHHHWTRQPQSQPWPRANPAVLSDSSTWLLDSGASHHMTSDLSNLATHQPYQGGEDVLLGDGSALSITHSGSSSFPSYSRPFLLMIFFVFLL